MALLHLSSLPFLSSAWNENRRIQGKPNRTYTETRIRSSLTTAAAKNSRRDFIIVGLGISNEVLRVLSCPQTCLASGDAELDEKVETASMVDDINAYSYLYPLELPSRKATFKWVESRRPERYSSAAPLSADARLRIVSERVDMFDNLIISVSICPPNSQFLKSNDKSTWTAKDVAGSFLSDKSSQRMNTGQKTAESSVIDAHTFEVDGEPYWYYEYLVRKSPNAMGGNLYRHYLASTAERDGYLYTLNASTLGEQWKTMGPYLKKTVDSFRLLPSTESYVPPYKDPWRFW